MVMVSSWTINSSMKGKASDGAQPGKLTTYSLRTERV